MHLKLTHYKPTIPQLKKKSLFSVIAAFSFFWTLFSCSKVNGKDSSPPRQRDSAGSL